MSKRTIRIYGASDDLVEIEGGDLTDEFGCYDTGGVVVLLPSGDRFDVRYGDRGVWEIEHAHATGALTVSIEKAPPGDEPDPYTDRATVTGDIARVQFWKAWPPTAREIRGRVERAWGEDINDEVMLRVWEALGAP
jgi:hypothetical protein